jgi:hypothetical protein
MGDMRNAYRIFVGKPVRRHHFGNTGVHDMMIKMDLKEIRYEA